jgi:hypothetical protein
VVDEDLAYHDARERFARITGWLRGRGVQARGTVVDADLPTARRDAEALAPGSVALN